MAKKPTRKSTPNNARAIMASRKEPPKSLDFFPTGPWGTRALLKFGLNTYPLGERTCWEPACGEGHMAETLREQFARVHASDVHDYGCGYEVGSFIGVGLDVASVPPYPVDWIITNPPYNKCLEFVLTALPIAREGVAMLVRQAWAEGGERYEELFSRFKPSKVLQFVERLPMHRGQWLPDGTTATSYTWVIWERVRQNGFSGTELIWIPPGQRIALEHPTDRARFAKVHTDENQITMFSKEKAA